MKCPSCMSKTKNGECDECKKLKACKRKYDKCCEEENIVKMNCLICDKQDSCLCFESIYKSKSSIINIIEDLDELFKK